MDRRGERRKAPGMGLFRRKADTEVEPDRCPICNERVPEEAEECAMCGADLRAMRPWSACRDSAELQRD